MDDTVEMKDQKLQKQPSKVDSSMHMLGNDSSQIDLPEYMADGFNYDQLDQLENQNDKTDNNVEASMTRAANFYPENTDKIDAKI